LKRAVEEIEPSRNPAPRGLAGRRGDEPSERSAHWMYRSPVGGGGNGFEPRNHRSRIHRPETRVSAAGPQHALSGGERQTR
jgi:hypothetical protein